MAAEKVNEHTPAPRPPELNGNPSLRIREKGILHRFGDRVSFNSAAAQDSRSIQDELFQNIAWLYEHEIYHYISETRLLHGATGTTKEVINYN